MWRFGLLSGGALMVAGSVLAALSWALVTAPGGEPLVISAAPAGILHSASFETLRCQAPLVLPDYAQTAEPAALTLAFGEGPRGFTVTLQPTDPARPEIVSMTVTDAAGRALVSADGVRVADIPVGRSAPEHCPSSAAKDAV